jgi:molybdopterin molybdotransferase
MAFGISDEAFCFGLPGNPVSNFIMFELLVKPFIYKMMGCNFSPPVTKAQLQKTITRTKTKRDSWLPVVFDQDGKVNTITYRGSAHINSLCHADGLLCIPAGLPEIKENTYVDIRLI